MSDESEKIVSEPKVYVFKTQEEANGMPPADDRYRLYDVASPGGDHRYVWERNPVAATGRAAKDLGVTASPIGKVVAAADLLGAFKTMNPDERAKLMAELQGVDGVAEPTHKGKKKHAE